MTSQTVNAGDIEVRLDDRFRLLSAVLAATSWPEKAQQLKPHGTHAHARATRKHVQEFSDHPAAKVVQAFIDRDAPIEALFTVMLLLDTQTFLATSALPDWVPNGFDKAMADFHKKAKLTEYWESEKFAWDKAFNESSRVFNSMQLKKYLFPYFGNIEDQLVFVPNIAYPSDKELGIRFGKEMIVLTPPPLAWGDSPPWPYDEDTMIMHAYRAPIIQFGRILLTTMLREHPEAVENASDYPMPVNDQFRAEFPTWEEQFVELFVTALVAMYLEEFVSDAEYKAYVLIEKKVRGMNILPGTVSVMRRFLQEQGNKYDTLLEFLPLFPKQLRVAKRIVTL